MRTLLAAIALAWTAGAAAHPHSASECREGGDFIRNAALARDAGYSREFIIGRLEEDFVLIRAFPAALRWFVQDEGDEDYLRREVAAVFDAPETGDRHRARFLERCTQRAARDSGAST
jgi:hypothetical protein